MRIDHSLPIVLALALSAPMLGAQGAPAVAVDAKRTKVLAYIADLS
jgi:hypothetical protein